MAAPVSGDSVAHLQPDLRVIGAGSPGCSAAIAAAERGAGVVLAARASVAPLPPGYELLTTCTAAVCRQAREPAAARQLLDRATDEASRALRRQAGFAID